MPFRDEPSAYAIRHALEVLGDAEFDADIRSAALAELDDLEANRDQWHSAANQYHQALEELLLYARGNPVVLNKIHTALGINDP